MTKTDNYIVIDGSKNDALIDVAGGGGSGGNGSSETTSQI